MALTEKEFHELNLALVGPGFCNHERLVLHKIYDWIFGPAQLAVVILEPAAIGKEYGVSASYMEKVIKRLTDAQVIKQVVQPSGYVLLHNEEWAMKSLAEFRREDD